ncbi:glycosyltransferase, partial [Hydrogenibacillus schlegelii]
MLLGVHILAKNEAARLPAALESVREIADEIIVIDTGSTDGTPEVARAFGARVLFVPWQDDFAAARNAGLEAARTDWVLVLDADERVVAGRRVLRSLIRETENEAFTVEIQNAIGSDPWARVVFRPVRLFRPSAFGGLRFLGRIHEQLVTPDGRPAPFRPAASPLVIEHVGYRPDVLREKGTAERNARLLARCLEERPDDPFYRYHRGITLVQLRRLREAAAELERALETAPKSAPYRPSLVRTLSLVYEGLGRPERARTLLQAEAPDVEGQPELWHLLGESFLAAGWVRPAEAAFRAALAAALRADPSDDNVRTFGVGGFRTRTRLTEALARQGRWAEAMEALRAALLERPDFAPARRLLEALVEPPALPSRPADRASQGGRREQDAAPEAARASPAPEAAGRRPKTAAEAWAMYRAGAVRPAAEFFLESLGDGTLTAEGAYALGELLYERGHGAAAEAMFVRAIALAEAAEGRRRVLQADESGGDVPPAADKGPGGAGEGAFGPAGLSDRARVGAALSRLDDLLAGVARALRRADERAASAVRRGSDDRRPRRKRGRDSEDGRSGRGGLSGSGEGSGGWDGSGGSGNGGGEGGGSDGSAYGGGEGKSAPETPEGPVGRRKRRRGRGGRRRGRRPFRRWGRKGRFRGDGRRKRSRVVSDDGGGEKERWKGGAAGMVRLTLAMIVRNEAGRLSRALQSVRDVVDEMIVVDTGSTDGTPEIARAHGARVVAVPWQDDFSAARNAGLEFARGDWVFVLDADEWLEPADRGRLKALLWSPALAAYEGGFVQIWNRLGDGREGVAVHPALRLFRNRPEHRFSGRVHEQIAAAIFRRKPDAALFVSDIRVHHDGYLRDVVRLRGKIERNERLLRQALLAAPDDPFLWYNLGVEALRRGAAAEAAQAFVRARETMAPAVSFAPLVYKYEALARRLAGDPDGARAVLEAGCRRYPHHPDLWHLWGEIEAAVGRLWAAEAAYATAYALGPAPPGVPTEAG